MSSPFAPVFLLAFLAGALAFAAGPAAAQPVAEVASPDGRADARTVDVPLGFLDAGRRYTATLYRDAADADWKTNPVAYEIETRQVASGDHLRARLAPGGGLAVRFAPAE